MSIEVKQIRDDVASILANYQHDKSFLVPILQDVQNKYYYLPEDVLDEVSRGLEIPLSQVYSVATFFKAFSLKPRGRHLISICLGTACHVRGAVRVLERIERELGINPGETSQDMKFTLETVNCVGACALGPIVMVDGEYFGEMKTDKVKQLLDSYD